MRRAASEYDREDGALFRQKAASLNRLVLIRPGHSETKLLLPKSKLPAVEYLMGKQGGDVKRFVLLGTDYARKTNAGA
jgi:hypothetical protein